MCARSTFLQRQIGKERALRSGSLLLAANIERLHGRRAASWPRFEVRAVATTGVGIARGLARAQPRSLRRRSLNSHRLVAGSFVRTVTKWLLLRQPARTPKIRVADLGFVRHRAFARAHRRRQRHRWCARSRRRSRAAAQRARRRSRGWRSAADTRANGRRQQ